MIAKAQRFEVIQRLMQLQNEHFWQELEALVTKAEQEEIALEPFTKEEFLASIKRSEQAIKDGKLYTLEDIIKETENY